MCQFNKKSVLFRHFVHQIVCALSPKGSNTDSTGDIEVPFVCSNTYLMKCLYFACLESCKNSSGIGLFGIFNNMKAYPRGPLEYDIYENLPNIEGLTYENGRISKIKSVPIAKQDNPYFKEVQIAVNSLNKHGILQKGTSDLINLSHKLDLWNEAYNFSTDRKIVLTEENIKNELAQYQSFIYK